MTGALADGRNDDRTQGIWWAVYDNWSLSRWKAEKDGPVDGNGCMMTGACVGGRS
jgi:hypothetical protein